MQRVDDPRFGCAYPRNRVDSAHSRGQQAVFTGILVGATADFEFGIEAGFAVDDDAPRTVDASGAALRPVRSEVVGHSIDVLNGDHLDTVDDTDATGVGRPDSAGFDDTAGGFEPPGRGQKVTFLANLVELD